jgi:hypothetical protein
MNQHNHYKHQLCAAALLVVLTGGAFTWQNTTQPLTISYADTNPNPTIPEWNGSFSGTQVGTSFTTKVSDDVNVSYEKYDVQENTERTSTYGGLIWMNEKLQRPNDGHEYYNDWTTAFNDLLSAAVFSSPNIEQYDTFVPFDGHVNSTHVIGYLTGQGKTEETFTIFVTDANIGGQNTNALFAVCPVHVSGNQYKPELKPAPSDPDTQPITVPDQYKPSLKPAETKPDTQPITVPDQYKPSLKPAETDPDTQPIGVPEKEDDVENGDVPDHSTTPEYPMEPSDPETPVEPELPANPETPIHPVTPVKPKVPTVPVVPIQPITPVVPTSPIEPVTPVQQAQPVQTPTIPANVVYPVERTTRVTPVPYYTWTETPHTNWTNQSQQTAAPGPEVITESMNAGATPETDASTITLPSTDIEEQPKPWGWLLLAPAMLLLAAFLREKLYSPVIGRLATEEEQNELIDDFDPEHDILFKAFANGQVGVKDVVTAPIAGKVLALRPWTNTITIRTKFDKVVKMTVMTTQDLTDQFAKIQLGDKVRPDDIIFKLDHVNDVHVLVQTVNRACKLNRKHQNEGHYLYNQERIAHFPVKMRQSNDDDELNRATTMA